MEIELTEKSELKISLYDIFNAMTEDEMRKVAAEYGWHSDQWLGVIDSLRNGYASKTYNPDIYVVRKAFFSMPWIDEYDLTTEENKYAVGCDVAQSMLQTMEAILEENAALAAEIHSMNSAWAAAYDFLKNRGFNNDLLYSINSVYVSEKYRKDPKTNYEIADNISKITSSEVSVEEFVTSWVNHQLEHFRGKYEPNLQTE